MNNEYKEWIQRIVGQWEKLNKIYNKDQKVNRNLLENMR
jgi:hypothetical protein